MSPTILDILDILDILESQISTDNGDKIEDITKDEFPLIKIMTTFDFLSSSDSTETLPLTTTIDFDYIQVSVMKNYTRLVLIKRRIQGA